MYTDMPRPSFLSLLPFIYVACATCSWQACYQHHSILLCHGLSLSLPLYKTSITSLPLSCALKFIIFVSSITTITSTTTTMIIKATMTTTTTTTATNCHLPFPCDARATGTQGKFSRNYGQAYLHTGIDHKPTDPLLFRISLETRPCLTLP